MSGFLDMFLAPKLLWGLLLGALPVIIHLINQLRHRTVSWGAMQFLLEARKMNKGMARLRQVLILAMRVLAILALIFIISRPLAGGWLGSATGGAPEAVLILLDRSSSMEESDPRSGESKRETALRKVSEMLKTTATGSRLVLIDSATLEPLELQNADDLLDLPATQGTSTAGDVPALLEAGLQYLTLNKTGGADVWLCSDLRSRDWDPEGGRWATLREGYEKLPGIRLAVLGYGDVAEDNVSVTVRKSELRRLGTKTELIMDVVLSRPVAPAEPLTIPVTFVVNGVRSVENVVLSEREVSLLGHSIELDLKTQGGWGVVEIPSDANPRDNSHYFVFAEPGSVPIAVVSEDSRAAELIGKAAGAPTDRLAQHEVVFLSPAQAAEIDWDRTALVVWQAPIPEGILADQLLNFVEAGRSVLFYPPRNPGPNEFAGLSWGGWLEVTEEDGAVASWRSDSDLLRNTDSGSSLFLGELALYRRCSIKGEGLELVRLENDAPLWLKARTDAGGAWFCGTLPQGTHSSLARDGIAFYVSLQRAIESGGRSIGRARQLEARTDAVTEKEGWSRLAGLSEEEVVGIAAQTLQAGAFKVGEGEKQRFAALNRPASEDDVRTITEDELELAFGTLEYSLVADKAGEEGSELVREIWRLFLIAMAIALLVEAVLCMPARREPEEEPAS